MMFKHSCGWDLNARILRLRTTYENDPSNSSIPDTVARLERIVREEIAQDRDLVWC